MPATVASLHCIKELREVSKKTFVVSAKKYFHTTGQLSKVLTSNNDVTKITLHRCHCNPNSSKFGCHFNLYFVFFIFFLLSFWYNGLRLLITNFSFWLCAVTSDSRERWALFTDKATNKRYYCAIVPILFPGTIGI